MDTTNWKVPRPGQGAGRFTVESGRVIASDPCYNMNRGEGTAARKGNWRASVDRRNTSWGNRVCVLTAWHEDVNPESRTFTKLRGADGGVDSGQFGFFDEKEFDPDGPFYDDCCSMTCSDAGFGSTKHGVVACSGFGDGCYPVEVSREGKEAVAFRVTFIGDDEN